MDSCSLSYHLINQFLWASRTCIRGLNLCLTNLPTKMKDDIIPCFLSIWLVVRRMYIISYADKIFWMNLVKQNDISFTYCYELGVNLLKAWDLYITRNRVKQQMIFCELQKVIHCMNKIMFFCFWFVCVFNFFSVSKIRISWIRCFVCRLQEWGSFCNY